VKVEELVAVLVYVEVRNVATDSEDDEVVVVPPLETGKPKLREVVVVVTEPVKFLVVV
jgi:hypothetical protein